MFLKGNDLLMVEDISCWCWVINGWLVNYLAIGYLIANFKFT